MAADRWQSIYDYLTYRRLPIDVGPIGDCRLQDFLAFFAA